VYAPGCAMFIEKRSQPRKTPPPNVGFSVGPLPSAKHKWHIDNALDAKLNASVIHNGERGFHIHHVWLYSSSISQSYRGFTDFGGICSGIPRLNTASTTTQNRGTRSPPVVLTQRAAGCLGLLTPHARLETSSESPTPQTLLSQQVGTLAHWRR
jgi:hypothetical protein